VQVAADVRALPPGSAVTLGVRPEHAQAHAHPVEGGVRGHVQLAEHLGDTTYLHVQVAGADGPLVVRTDPDNPLDTGDTAHLAFPPARCFLFDAQGRTLPAAVRT